MLLVVVTDDRATSLSILDFINLFQEHFLLMY